MKTSNMDLSIKESNKVLRRTQLSEICEKRIQIGIERIFKKKIESMRLLDIRISDKISFCFSTSLFLLLQITKLKEGKASRVWRKWSKNLIYTPWRSWNRNVFLQNSYNAASFEDFHEKSEFFAHFSLFLTWKHQELCSSCSFKMAIFYEHC